MQKSADLKEDSFSCQKLFDQTTQLSIFNSPITMTTSTTSMEIDDWMTKLVERPIAVHPVSFVVFVEAS
jgi:hypothetical protein